jgi:hypothetical protein
MPDNWGKNVDRDLNKEGHDQTNILFQRNVCMDESAN